MTNYLDDIVPDGNLIDKIRRINEIMKNVSPQRISSVVSQTIRKDTKLVKALKSICDYRCQFPDCGARIQKSGGGYYIEVAHIQPVKSGGKSIIGNLLVLCPNHHKEFDFGDLMISEQNESLVKGSLNGRKFEIALPTAR
jgi:predicted restriction endonuclease